MRRGRVRDDAAYVRGLRREVDRYRTALADVEAEIVRVRSKASERVAALNEERADAEERARRAEANLAAVL